MTLTEPRERQDLRQYALLLTLGFWLVHLVLTFSRGIWLPVPTEALSARLAIVTVSGLALCALQYPIIERVQALRFPRIAAIMLSCAICAGLLNAGAPVAVHYLAVGQWHSDAVPIRFVSIAAHWMWVFLAWASMILALAFSLRSRATLDDEGHQRLDGTDDLWLPHRGQLARVALKEIARFEAAGDYVVVHTADRRFMAHASLRSLEERLDPAEFSRVHRGAIVRLEEVAGIERGPTGLLRLRLRNGDVVRVSRTYRRRLEKRLGAL